MALTQTQIEDYLKSTKRILLSTVTEDNTADIRILGAIATDRAKVYFATANDSRKVKQIENNNNVAVYFEAPGQEFPNYINANVYGKARKVTDESEKEHAKELIKANLPKFEFTDSKSIYVVEPTQVKVYNSSAELAQDKIQIVTY